MFICILCFRFFYKICIFSTHILLLAFRTNWRVTKNFFLLLVFSILNLIIFELQTLNNYERRRKILCFLLKAKLLFIYLALINS